MRRTLLLTTLAVMAFSSTAAQADGFNWSHLLDGLDDGGIIVRTAPPVYVVVPSPRGRDDRPYGYSDHHRDDRADWRAREDHRQWREQHDRRYAYRNEYRRGDNYREGGDD
ncbi:MAG: hypothetical protein PF483_14830 [Halothiobacillus sp.]|nr:hypothetical protein [Halothiobacillus sp.]